MSPAERATQLATGSVTVDTIKYAEFRSKRGIASTLAELLLRND